MEKIYYAEDLYQSGPIIQMLFAYEFPNGLTMKQMQNSEHGWVQRAALRILGYLGGDAQ